VGGLPEKGGRFRQQTHFKKSSKNDPEKNFPKKALHTKINNTKQKTVDVVKNAGRKFFYKKGL
jgi:hypothetical protein